MRNGVTLSRRLSLVGCKPRINTDEDIAIIGSLNYVNLHLAFVKCRLNFVEPKWADEQAGKRENMLMIHQADCHIEAEYMVGRLGAIEWIARFWTVRATRNWWRFTTILAQDIFLVAT